MRKMTALLSALLADFEKEIKAVCTAPDPGRDAACAPAANVKPTGVFADVANIMAPAAARLKLASEKTRADAAALAADQSIPLKHVLDRAESIAKEAIPRALKPILPALRAARNMGKLDPSGVGAMMVDVDAAEARVSAVLEAGRARRRLRVLADPTHARRTRERPRELATDETSAPGRPDRGSGGGARDGSEARRCPREDREVSAREPDAAAVVDARRA
jgi:hypothetical protein